MKQWILAIVLALGASTSVTATARADEHRLIVGMATTSVTQTRPGVWWHGEDALDLTNNLGATGGANVFFQSHIWSGTGAMVAVAREYAITTDGTRKVDGVDIALVRNHSVNPALYVYEYDRSGTAPWGGAPDGLINAVDIGLVRAQYNHSCQAAP